MEPEFSWLANEEGGEATFEIGGYRYELLLPSFLIAKQIHSALKCAYNDGRGQAIRDVRDTVIRSIDNMIW